jgi:Cof subfamily protein (haloacid dehalogenase superfamily)
MSATYRLIVLDVDGTLVGADRRIPASTLGALRAARERGIRVTLATGRMYASARPFAETIEADAPLILYNGARIENWPNRTVLMATALARPDARRALLLLREFPLHVNLYVGERLFIERVTPAAEASMRKDGVEAHPVGDLVVFLDGVPEEPIKLLIIGSGEVLEAFAQRFRPDEDAYGPELVRSEEEYLEVLPRGVSKGRALLRLCEHLGIEPALVAAFGDNRNDADMLARAGLGVAMATAPPEVRAAARLVAPPGEEGLARVLWEHVLR